MTPEQLEALEALRAALKLATDSGLFDYIHNTGDVHPDIVNRFCDAVENVR